MLFGAVATVYAHTVLLAYQAVNAYTTILPMQVTSLTIASVSVHLPLASMLTGPIEVTVAGLNMELCLRSPNGDVRQAKSFRRGAGPHDLTDSLADAAQSFLHEKGNEEIAETIQESRTEETATHASSSTSEPGAEGYFAAVVQSLLARLSVQLKDLSVVLVTNASTKYAEAVSFELTAESAELSRSLNEDSSVTAGPAMTVLRRKTRRIEIMGVSVWSFSPDQDLSSSPRNRRKMRKIPASPSSSNHSTPIDEDSVDVMRMTQAIQDLSVSTVSVASCYTDAMSDADSIYKSVVNEETANSPGSHTRSLQVERHKILHMGNQPIRVEATTEKTVSKAFPPAGDDLNVSPGAADSDAQNSDKTIQLVGTNIEMAAGPLCGLLRTGDLRDLIFFLSQLNLASTPSSSETSSTPIASSSGGDSSSMQISVSVIVESVHLLCAYDSVVRLTQEQQAALTRSIEIFWTRPSKSQISIGHLRLDCGRIFASYTRRSATSEDLSVQIMSLDITEYFLPEGGVAQAVLPIIIFDHNLPAYVPNVVTNDFSEAANLSLLDWRRHKSQCQTQSKASKYFSTSFGDKVWHLRPIDEKHWSQTSSDNARQAQEVMRVQASLCRHTKKAHWILYAAPLQVFADMSILERLMPLLHFIGATYSVSSIAPSTTSNSLLVSTETLHAADSSTKRSEADESTNQTFLKATLDLLRLHLRVPPPPSFRDGRDDGPALRSGLLCADLLDIRAFSGLSTEQPQSSTSTQRVRYSSNVSNKTEPHYEASTAKINFYCQPPESDTAKLVFSIGRLATSDEGEDRLRPCVTSASATASGSDRTVKTELTRFFLPFASASLTKMHIDTFQLLADDGATLATRVCKIGASSENEEDGLKILGSRFFGSRASLSDLSMSGASSRNTIDMPDIGKPRATSFSLEIMEFAIVITVPRSQSKTPTHLQLTAKEVCLLFEPSHDKNTSLLDLSVTTVMLMDITAATATRVILERTLSSCLSRGVHPMITLRMLFYEDKLNSHRESRIEPVLQNCTLTLTEDMELLKDIERFLQAPAGVFEDVEPNEVTRLRAKLQDVSLLLAPSSQASRVVFVFEDVTFRCSIMSESPTFVFRSEIKNATCLIVDRIRTNTEGRKRTPTELWSGQGFSKVLQVAEFVSTMATSKFTLPDLDIAITKIRAKLCLCADTLFVLPPLLSAVFPAKSQQAKSNEDEAPQWDSCSSGSTTMSQNLLDSVEDDAFQATSTMSSIPDMLDDDIPSRPEFFGSRGLRVPDPPSVDYSEVDLGEDEFFGEESVTSVTETKPSSEPLASSFVASQQSVVSSSDVCTIRLLDSAGVRPTLGYFSRENLAPRTSNPIRGLTSTFRLAIEDCDLEIKLHGGYDWEFTRNEIEAEIKKVRRRLQKIKQLLDQGQKPSDSVEEAAEDLMQSIHISLDPEADATAALNALNDELGAQSETASSASTWQSLPHNQAKPSAAGAFSHNSAAAAPKMRSKLERSYQSQVDMILSGIGVRYDAITPGTTLASSLDASVRSVQILDNIRTSTWHAFLTEMIDPKQRLPCESGQISKMVQVQVLGVRGTGNGTRFNTPSQETRLRAKIAPLRLHVDQDALDFLKKFFAFKPPSEARATRMSSRLGKADEAAESSEGAFIQYAEVLPIKLKLDYKPKRVDYNLLRQGKIIEMMNFFHFDEAEMTLRHVKLRGITGWAKLFDTLNDIWTPDVKVNQLADVLAGIAPLRSVVNVGSGVADLILLPIEQYQKDGRLGKGIQRGAKRFAKATALEAVKLGARLATGTQVILERAEHVLGGTIDASFNDRSTCRSAGHTRSRQAAAAWSRGSEGEWAEAGGVLSTIIDSPASKEEDYGRGSIAPEPPATFSKYAEQPESLRAALTQAYSGLSRGVSSAAQTILAVPMEVYEAGPGSGNGSGGRTVMRAVPIAVMQGARGASEAVSKTLLGLQGALQGPQLDLQRLHASNVQSRPSPSASASRSSTPRAGVGVAGKYKRRPGPSSGTR